MPPFWLPPSRDPLWVPAVATAVAAAAAVWLLQLLCGCCSCCVAAAAAVAAVCMCACPHVLLIWATCQTEADSFHFQCAVVGWLLSWALGSLVEQPAVR